MEMQAADWYALIGIALFAIGFLGLAWSDHLLRKILGLNLMSSGAFLLLAAPADRGPGLLPDPVPQALVLTGIVVAVSATALALALACRIAAAPNGDGRPDDRGE